MTISVLSAAAHLVSQSERTLSNLELQKLIYLAHMFYMGRREGEPLVHGHFEAWDYGPVHPELYHAAKIFGSQPVSRIFGRKPPDPGCDEAQILAEAYQSLGDAGPGVLVNITHKEGGAWDRNYIAGVRRITIPNEDILREYHDFEYH